MSSSETTDPGQGHRRLGVWLVAAHLAVGLVLGWFTRWSVSVPPRYPDYAVFVLAGVVFAQACLIGIWTVFGSSPLLVRLIGLVASIVYLGTLFGFCIDELRTEIVLMVAATTISIAALLLAPRCLGVELAAWETDAPAPHRTQFSIRQLLIFTAVVACLLAVGRRLWPAFGVAVFAVTVSFAPVGITAAWSLLGAKRVIPGLVVLFGVAIAVAYILPRVFPPAEPMSLWAAATLTAALTLAVTLGVLRSRGFRLRRQRR